MTTPHLPARCSPRRGSRRYVSAIWVLALSAMTWLGGIAGRAQEITPPAFSLFSSLHGRVIDEGSGAPLAGVEVRVAGSGLTTTTDADGRYRLGAVSPGLCVLEFAHPGYEVTSVTGVDAGKERDSIDVALRAEGSEVIELEKLVVDGGGPPRNSVTLDRQQAAIVVDMLTAADYSKFIGGDVSDIVIRMPGFSTSSRGSFAVVRGLSERYNPILRDGLVMPSSDPERQAPELDLFPTRLVDAVVVSKVFEPRLPATATGGAVDLRTKPLPEGRFAQVRFGLGADEGALKSDASRRGPSHGLSDLFAVGANRRPSGPVTEEDRYARAGGAGVVWLGRDGRFPFGGKFSGVYEDRIDLNSEGRAFGYSLTLSYDSSAASEHGRVFGPQTGVPVIRLPNLLQSDGSFVASVGGEDYSEYEQEVKLGGLLTLGYAFNDRHVLSLNAFISQIGIQNVRQTYHGFAELGLNTAEQLELLYQSFATGVIDPEFRGFNSNDGRLAVSESIYYRERNLGDFRLSGEHYFGDTRATRLNWSVARLRASQDEPDFSFLGYTQRYSPEVTSQPFLQILYGQPVRTPTRFWRHVTEKTWVGKIDAETRFVLGRMRNAVFRSGLSAEQTDRKFGQNAFYLSAGPNSDAATLEELVEKVKGSDFGVTRGAVPTPANAVVDRKVSAAYASIGLPLLSDRPWVRSLELFVGVRAEQYQTSVVGRGRYSNQSSADYYLDLLNRKDGRIPDFRVPGIPVLPTDVFSREVDEGTIHPSVALTWSPVNRLNVRLGYARTVARPSFRELGPYFTNDDVTGEIQHGNVFLDTSRIDNYDFRVEYFFPRGRDLVALSLFSKRIENPIEKQLDVIVGGGFSAIGWFNNPNDAELAGLEFELAKNLGFLGGIGSWFTVGGNATFIDARVAFAPGEPGIPGTERNLFDQPEWIRSAYVTWDHRKAGFAATLSWYAISDVLRNVDIEKWSTYVAAHARFDLTMSQRLGRDWQLRFSVRNLADPERKFIADPAATSNEIVYRTFKDGRNFSLTASRDF